jgi:hypothetical protein
LKPSSRAWAFVTGLLFCVAAAHAATVLASNGDAWMQRRQQTVPVRPGTEFQDADELVTGPGAEVLVRFADEARMVVRADSRIELRQLLRKEELQRQQKIAVVKGGLRYLSGEKTDRGRVVFTSTHVTIGIRGTDIEIALDEVGGNANPPGTYLKVNSGIAVLTGLDGTAVELAPGEVAMGAEAQVAPSGTRSLRRPSAKKVDIAPANLFKTGALDSLLR